MIYHASCVRGTAGDHIRKNNGIYYHHMLVVEVVSKTEIKVIHYTAGAEQPDGGLMQTSGLASAYTLGSGPLLAEVAEIVECEVTIDLSEDKIELVEYQCEKCEVVYDGPEAIKRARDRKGEQEYSLLFNNCETFLNWVKIDKKTSNQSVTVGAVAALGFAGAIVTGVAAGIGAFLYTKSSKSKKQDPL